MNQLVELVNLARDLCSNGWLQFLVVALIIARIVPEVDQAHSTLHKSAPKWKKSFAAVRELSLTVVTRLNRLMGADVQRKRRPSIQATLLAGDVVLYWAFAIWLFAVGSLFVLLLALKRPHDIKLWALSVAATVVLYFFAAVYRNIGAKSYGSLVQLYKENAGSRRTIVSMSAAIAVMATAVALVECVAWSFYR